MINVIYKAYGTLPVTLTKKFKYGEWDAVSKYIAACVIVAPGKAEISITYQDKQ